MSTRRYPLCARRCKSSSTTWASGKTAVWWCRRAFCSAQLGARRADVLCRSVIASAVAPLTPGQDPVYGSSNSGVDVHCDASVEPMMQALGRTLNLAPHLAGVHAASACTLVTACDVEVHRGSDEKHYVVRWCARASEVIPALRCDVMCGTVAVGYSSNHASGRRGRAPSTTTECVPVSPAASRLCSHLGGTHTHNGGLLVLHSTSGVCVALQTPLSADAFSSFGKNDTRRDELDGDVQAATDNLINVSASFCMLFMLPCVAVVTRCYGQVVCRTTARQIDDTLSPDSGVRRAATSRTCVLSCERAL